MTKMAILGPPGTFSDYAAKKFMSERGSSYHALYSPTINSVLSCIGTDCEFGILPIENLSEGFISAVLDRLLSDDLRIAGEVILPIQFSLVSKENSLADVNRVFVQFFAKGQCSKYLESLDVKNMVTTESNMESLHLALSELNNTAAVVPKNSFDPKWFPLVIENITDHENNQTRFIVLATSKHKVECKVNCDYKTSMVLVDENDYPGFLGDVLAAFSSRSINLTSIISRPSRQAFGKYHFYIDFDGHVDEFEVAAALRDIRKLNPVRVMGSYLKAEPVKIERPENMALKA